MAKFRNQTSNLYSGPSLKTSSQQKAIIESQEFNADQSFTLKRESSEEMGEADHSNSKILFSRVGSDEKPL